MPKASTKSASKESQIRDYLENIISLLPGHIYWKDLNCRFLGCNDLQAKTAGLASRKDIVGKSAYDVITANQSETERRAQAEAIDRVDREVLRTGQAMTLEEPLVLPDGTQKVFLSQKVPLKGSDGNVVGLLGISMDITAQKEAELNIKKAKEEAEAANKIKDDFLYNMRHDIRTPFTGILSLSEFLAHTEPNEKRKEQLSQITYSSNLLLAYLNEILECTKINAGTVPVLSKPFDLNELIKNCLTMLKPALEQKQLKVIELYPESVPHWLMGDRFRVQRILINLLSNAVKFTDKGEIEVGVEVAQKKGRDILLKIWVRDTGIGIPKEKYDFIFEKFSRLKPSYTGTYRGTGLGLQAVRQLVHELEGDIFVKSKMNEGSQFTCILNFQLPLISDPEYLKKISDIDRKPNDNGPITFRDKNIADRLSH